MPCRPFPKARPARQKGGQEITKEPLFGGSLSWNKQDWKAVDDRVRGGASHSYMSFHPDHKPQYATFHGILDIDTLGGAGFASQRTVHSTGNGKDSGHAAVEGDCTWNLSGFDGILLTGLSTKDKQKRFALTIKDEVLPRDPNTGREQSTVSWEYDFCIEDTGSSVFIPWKALTPTYRGREVEGKTLNLHAIRRFSLMMRSFFAEQKGPFSLNIASISAYKVGAADERKVVKDDDDDQLGEKRSNGANNNIFQKVWRGLTACTRL